MGHQGGDLLLVHLHLFNLVDEVEKLLFADSMSGRHFAFLEFFVDDPFDLADFAFLLHVADGDGDTRLSGTSRTSAAVCVAFRIIGQAVVDHVCQIVHIQAAGSHIGSN